MTQIYKFLIPGECPALKNDRDPIVGKGGKFLGTRPSQRVEKFIRMAKDKIARQLPPGFEVIQSPTEVAVAISVGVYVAGYPKTLPKSDLDNAATTLQECLFTARTKAGPVLEDDRQVAEYIVRRFIISDREAAFSRIWVWVIDDTHEEARMKVITSLMGRL